MCKNLQEDNEATCLECKKEFTQETDIQLCFNCSDLFYLDWLWCLHDNKMLDALDFNENESLRERFRINPKAISLLNRRK